MIRIAGPMIFTCALAAAPLAAQEQEQVLPAEAGSYGIGQATLLADAGSYGVGAAIPLADSGSAVLPTIPVTSPAASVASPFRRKFDVERRPPFERTPARPTALVPLYAGFATLQALDYASTTRALAGGNAREPNPMMGGIVGNRAAFVAVKAAAATAVICAGEKMWKKNRVAAVIFVAALNGAMTAVVARNYAVR